MLPCNNFPYPPTTLDTLSGPVQAGIIINLWNSAAEAYALCAKDHGALVIWIRAEE